MMALLRMFVVVFLAVLVIYTGIVMANHGAGLVPIFFGDMAEMAWPGQFNLDFMGFLLLSGLWISWRHDYSLVGWALTPLALFGGMLFLCIYLLIMSFRVNGDLTTLLIGEKRAAR
ncbi:MAG: hypothetical protein AAFR51_01110 [Pseudomonadota bacterium]